MHAYGRRFPRLGIHISRPPLFSFSLLSQNQSSNPRQLTTPLSSDFPVRFRPPGRKLSDTILLDSEHRIAQFRSKPTVADKDFESFCEFSLPHTAEIYGVMRSRSGGEG